MRCQTARTESVERSSSGAPTGHSTAKTQKAERRCRPRPRFIPWATKAQGQEHVAEAVSDPSQEQMQEHRRWNQMLAKVGSVEKEVKNVESAVKKDVSAVMEKVEGAEKLLMEKVEAVEKLLRELRSRSA